MQISSPFGNCLEQLMIASNLFILRYYPLNAFGKQDILFQAPCSKDEGKNNQPRNQQNPSGTVNSVINWFWIIHMYEIGNPRKTALAQRLCLSIFWERLFVGEWRQLILLPNLPFLHQFFLSPSMTESTYVVNTKVKICSPSFSFNVDILVSLL